MPAAKRTYQRMKGIDAMFVYTETDTALMHTLKIAVLDVSHLRDRYSMEVFRERLQQLLPLLPPFYKRIVEVPLGLHHPVWIVDPEFDLDRHVRSVRLDGLLEPAPMNDIISELASHRLPRDRPLWEMVVIEQADCQKIAVAAKIHHALADGLTAARLLNNVMTTIHDPTGPTAPEPPKPEPIPSRGRLIRDAVFDRIKSLGRLPGLLWQTTWRLARWFRARHSITRPRPLLFSGPATSFNQSLSPRRRFASATLSLPEIKQIKDAFDVKINDVVLTLVTQTLRHYLQSRGEAVDKPLVASIPVNTETSENLLGNRVSHMLFGLPIHMADPADALGVVHEQSDSAKRLHHDFGTASMLQWSELGHNSTVRLLWDHVVPRLDHPPINLVVSNVPGPRQALTNEGARLIALYSVGPVLERIGLNVTVWSYLDRLNFSFLSCPKNVPDLDALVGELHGAWKALQSASSSAKVRSSA